MGAGLALDRVWAGPVGYIFSFLQMLWFPVGLFTGSLLMILLKYVAREPIRFRLKRDPYVMGARKKNNHLPLNGRLIMRFHLIWIKKIQSKRLAYKVDCTII